MRFLKALVTVADPGDKRIIGNTLPRYSILSDWVQTGMA